MANRFLLKQFAENATNNGQFGSYQAGSPTITSNTDQIQALNAYLNGWLDATSQATNLPRLEELQGLEYLICKAIKELYKEGIPEWLSTETYYLHSFCQYEGMLFRNKTGNYTTNNPLTDTTNWENYGNYILALIGNNYTAIDGSNAVFNNIPQTAKNNIALNSPASFYCQNVIADMDFNNYVNRGSYYISAFIPGTTTNVAKANGPYSTNVFAGTLVVQNGDNNDTGYVLQEFNCITDKLKWFRNKINGVWGPWFRQASGLPNYSAGITISTNGATNVDTTSTYTPTVDGIVYGRVDINSAGSKAHLIVKDLTSNVDIVVIFAMDNGDRFSSIVPVVAGMPLQITTNIGTRPDVSAAVFYPYFQ